MDRLERLVNLVAALVDADRPLTRHELRRRVGGYSDDPDAFRRNFERDKDILRQMGMPLVTEVLDGGPSDDQAGYRIPRERYELADPGLSEAELSALRLAAAAVRLDASWGSEATLSALRKLAAAGGDTGPARPDPAPAGGDAGGSAPAPRPGVTAAGGDPGPPRPGVTAAGGDAGPSVAPARPGPAPARLAELAGGEAVATVFGAITERRRLRFGYRGEARTVDPWRLSYRRGQWYLSGFDHHRGGERVYRIDRIEGSVQPDGDAGVFDRPGGGAAAPVPAWQLGDGPEVRVRVRVDGDQAPWAVASVGEEAVTARLDDGSVEVELAVTNGPALRSWVLGFLHHAEVIGPPEVRDDLRRWLEAAADAGPLPPAPAAPASPTSASPSSAVPTRAVPTSAVPTTVSPTTGGGQRGVPG